MESLIKALKYPQIVIKNGKAELEKEGQESDKEQNLGNNGSK